MKLTLAAGDSLPMKGDNTIPPAYDLLWAGLAVAWVVLLATALILLFKDQNTPRAALLWFLVILVFPFLGSVVYLVTRSRRKQQQRQQA
ncbi:PLDc N-terminal domain-containing protein [Corynebacterium sp.]|uniref:PLDc N-terminal domain-containing protein n=1 Tax=Corynebacterium sp. TaxID=1720 RepID=UPI0026210EF3|nr:PLDc N-terminal domain-containing protein [Corynebacterium sp.]